MAPKDYLTKDVACRYLKCNASSCLAVEQTHPAHVWKQPKIIDAVRTVSTSVAGSQVVDGLYGARIEHKAHLMPHSQCSTEWGRLGLAKLLLGKDAGDSTISSIKLVHGVRRVDTQEHPKHKSHTGIKHSVHNKIMVADQDKVLDADPSVIILPLLSREDIQNWKDEEYEVAVICVGLDTRHSVLRGAVLPGAVSVADLAQGCKALRDVIKAVHALSGGNLYSPKHLKAGKHFRKHKLDPKLPFVKDEMTSRQDDISLEVVTVKNVHPMLLLLKTASCITNHSATEPGGPWLLLPGCAHEEEECSQCDAAAERHAHLPWPDLAKSFSHPA